jgi:hypothetical protein
MVQERAGFGSGMEIPHTKKEKKIELEGVDMAIAL